MTKTALRISKDLPNMADTIDLDAKALRMDFVTSMPGEMEGNDQERARLNAFAVAKLLKACAIVREAAIAVRQAPDEPEFARQWEAMLAGEALAQKPAAPPP